MNQDNDSILPPGPKGRLFVWPNISPDQLKAPRPCHYLTWPAWEIYRRKDLGQPAKFENFYPLEIEDPPAFQASLKTLLEASGFKAAGLHLAGLDPTFSLDPYSKPESPESLAKAILGESPGPGASSGAGQGQSLGLKTNPAYLYLSMWACARHLSRQAEEIFRKSLEERKTLMEELMGDANNDFGLEHQKAPSIEPPVLSFIFSSWLSLAAPYLTLDDGLWTPYEESREEATILLDRFASVKASIWPAKNSLA
ncbi:MAG: hypothetical protein LBE80_06350 [Deltaproteobacteria bacterium]|jgi:hypothetical protein|nr:hypothetical protein [Deltaproteobacteria bacterium]